MSFRSADAWRRLTGCGKYWYRSVDEVTCGDFYEGYFLSSCKSGIGAYTFGTAKAKYIGAPYPSLTVSL